MGEYINFLWPTICSFMIYFQFSEQNYLFHGSKCFLDSRHSPRSLKCLCKNIRGFAGFSIRTVSTMVAKQFNPENFHPRHCPQNYSWNSLQFVSKIIIQNYSQNHWSKKTFSTVQSFHDNSTLKIWTTKIVSEICPETCSKTCSWNCLQNYPQKAFKSGFAGFFIRTAMLVHLLQNNTTPKLFKRRTPTCAKMDLNKTSGPKSKTLA